MLQQMMKARFASSKNKDKVLKKIGSRMRVGRKALDCFKDLIVSIENSGDALYKLDPVYHFLQNGKDVLGSGRTLSDCFEGWLPPEQIVLIKTGEETGKVSEAIEQCINLNKQVSLIKKTIKKASFLPAFAALLLLGLLVGTYQKGIPLFEELAPREEWGEAAMQLYDMTHTFGSDPLRTIIVVILSIVAVAWAIPNLDLKGNPSFRNYIDRYVPFFGIYRTVQASIFLRSLATLLSSGVRVKDALDLIVKNSSPYVGNRIVEMRDKISSGLELSECFKNPFLGDYGKDLADMAQGDSLIEALEEVADETMEEVLEGLPAKLGFLGKAMVASCLMVVVFGMGAFYEIIDSIT